MQMGVPFYRGDKVVLLPTAEEKYRDMFDAIRRAERYIHMDYFKLQDDSVCAVMFRLLEQKAAEGVKVRIVFDALGNRFSLLPLRKPLLRQLRASGIDIRAFDRARFPWLNHGFHRNHHKVAIVDGEVAYTGGMNVADYYLHGKRGVGAWRDMHMRISGPAVAGYEQVFADMWYRTTGERISVDNASQDEARPALPCPTDAALLTDAAPLTAVVNRIPRISPSIMREAYCAAIDGAQSLIQIVNPYACLLGDVRRSLYAALERGVRVEIMVSTRSDGTANADVTGMEMKKLMARGAMIYYFDAGFHHSKCMMIDSLFCTVGTANLDARSLMYDYEVNAFIFDPHTTAELQQIFERDKSEHCFLLTPSTWKELFPPRRRLRASLYMPFKRLL